MPHQLNEIAQTLIDADKKVQLIYAFNGSGKTRLSREFIKLLAPNNPDAEPQEEAGINILYYNAFTEDLFFWDNDDLESSLVGGSVSNVIVVLEFSAYSNSARDE